MRHSVRLADEALAEIAEAAGWYEERRSGLAARLVRAVDECLRRLSEHPLSGARLEGAAPDVALRRLLVSGFPYQVVYVVLTEEVRVVAVAHDRREPGYWRSRLAAE